MSIYSPSTVQHDVGEMCLTVRRITFVKKAPLKKESSTQQHYSGQRRRKAVLSEPKGGAVRASMSFVKHKRPLLGGAAPLKPLAYEKCVSP